VFLQLVLTLSLAQQSVSVSKLTHQAQEAFQLGKYSEARDALQQALKYEPRSPALWSYLGLAEAQLNELDAAISHFQKALSFAPTDAKTHFNLGLLYRRRGDSKQALQTYRQGLRLDPGDSAANQNFALLLMEAGQFREAIAPLQKLMKLGTTDLSVRVALIESYLKCGMTVEGEREISSFLQIPSATSADKLKLAKVLIEDKQPAEAQSVLEHVARASPDLAEVHALLGRLQAAKDQYEAAAREMGLAVRLSPDTAEYSLRLAEILILWKQYPTAIEFLGAIKHRFGKLLEYQYKLGLTYFALRHIPEAIAVFENLAREHPDLDLVQFFLGNVYQTTGAFDKAEPHYKRAIELNPKQASYYAALAQMLRKGSADRTEEALTYLEKALMFDPQDVQSKLALGLCYEKKRDFAKAQNLLEAVLQQEPDLIPAHVALARVYYSQKKKEEGNRERSIIARLESEQQTRKSQIETPAGLPTR
jgi:tetratricopeptide (TPR) repeat protein